MNAKELAAKLNGNAIGIELCKITAEEWHEIEEEELVIVFGASDDLCEVRGAVADDEYGCYGGGELFFVADGILANACEDSECPYFAKEKQKAMRLKIESPGIEGCTFSYDLPIPHEKFRIFEGPHTYCIGVVFSLKDVAEYCKSPWVR
jgi:hypothetical protein